MTLYPALKSEDIDVGFSAFLISSVRAKNQSQPYNYDTSYDGELHDPSINYTP